jgi:hypothetical protein
MTRNGQFHETYITLNTVQNHVSPYQCLDFHYYITEPSVNAFIGVAWSVGAGPFPITEVRAKSENKWEHHRYTYTAQGQSAYNVIIFTYTNFFSSFNHMILMLDMVYNVSRQWKC